MGLRNYGFGVPLEDAIGFYHRVPFSAKVRGTRGRLLESRQVVRMAVPKLGWRIVRLGKYSE